MNHKVIRLGGRSYVILSYTPATAKRIITSLRGFEVEKLSDVPEGSLVLAEALSIAIAGSGVLSRFKAFFIRKRIIRNANAEELIAAIGSIIKQIPTSEFYAISRITQQFNTIIAK